MYVKLLARQERDMLESLQINLNLRSSSEAKTNSGHENETICIGDADLPGAGKQRELPRITEQNAQREMRENLRQKR